MTHRPSCRLFRWLAAVLGGATGLLGAGPATPAKLAGVEGKSPPADQRLVDGVNQLGWRLLGSLGPEGGAPNVMLSPTSAAVALAMVYHGARGETQSQIAALLGVSELQPETVAESGHALLAGLNEVEGAELAVANALWGRKGVKFKPQFFELCRDAYGADVEITDFAAPDAAEPINQWVAGRTHGRIEKIIGKVNPEAVLFLLNAVYFKARWAVPFDPAETADGTFRRPGAEDKTVRMMSRSGVWRYAEDGGARMVRMPYTGGRFSFVVLLPPPGSVRIGAEEWGRLAEALKPRGGRVVLPRFKVAWDGRLNDSLRALGMVDAFEERLADFSGMATMKGPLFVGEVLQRTWLEVNEEGSEAAAATSVEMDTKSEEPRFDLVVDRPFLCAIEDARTGALLFLGAVADPQ
ncbi:MAG: serpin family protein [Armatimonadetes bacterium]|nr:serpin family protein [Armatimonadota bacterium]